jgi:hydroxycarboxylate dehydrogenase B
VVVREDPLRRFAEAVCRGLGAAEDAASEVAGHLVRANLAGHDAHGVARLAGYAAEADAGALVPAARPRLLRETAATALFDAGRGLGPHSTAVALAWCLERAAGTGLAAAAVRRSSSIGRVGEYGERAAASGMLAIVTVGLAGPGAGGMVPHGGRDRFFDANPWSFAAPGRQRALVVDAPSSTVTEGEVRLARARGDALPPDCVTDRYGRPSTDPEDLDLGGGLVPLGGAVAGHRGGGLAFASALFGALAMIGDEPMRPGTAGGVFVEVVDPAAFGDSAAYRDLVDATLGAAAAARPAAGRADVPLPGDAEARARAERGRAGIRLPDGTWAGLSALAERYGVPLPEAG